MSDSTISIDLPENEFEFSEMFMNTSQDNMDTIFSRPRRFDSLHHPFDFTSINEELQHVMDDDVEMGANDDIFQHDNDM